MYRTTWIITVSAIPFSYTESHVPHDNANKLFSYMSKVSNIVFISITITTLPVKALFSKLCTFLHTRSSCSCGADPGRWPLMAAARGCTFPLWRIRRGTVEDPPWLVWNRESNVTNLVSNVLTHRYLNIRNNYRTIYMKWVSPKTFIYNCPNFPLQLTLFYGKKINAICKPHSCANTEFWNYQIRHVVLYIEQRYWQS